MEYTVSIIETDISLIPSLLKVLQVFHMRLFYYRYDEAENIVKDIDIKCNDCRRITGVYLKDKNVQ